MHGHEEHLERIVFYLEHAYDYSWGFSGDEGNSLGKIAAKAFSTLCQKVFRDDDDRARSMPKWLRDVVNPVVLPKIFWFFKAQFAISGAVVNPVVLPKTFRFFKAQFAISGATDHDVIVMGKFLSELAKMGWQGFTDREISEAQRELIQQSKPELLRILWSLGELDYLWKQKQFVTAEDLVGLRKFIFTDGSGKQNGYETVEEALADGNRAARVYLIFTAYFSERKRQRSVVDAAQCQYDGIKEELARRHGRISWLTAGIKQKDALPNDKVKYRRERDRLTQDIEKLNVRLEMARRELQAVSGRYRRC